MTREQGFERRLAEWMDDGPLEAPQRPIAAAITFASDHPRRALFGRRAVTGGGYMPAWFAWQKRTWAVAVSAVAVGALLVAGLILGPAPRMSGPGSPSPSPSASPTGAPTPASWATEITGPLHVTSQLGSHGEGFGFGVLCGGMYCEFAADTLATNDRLSGCYVLQPTGDTNEGAWGSAAFYDGSCPYGTPRTGARMTWAGAWFAAGPRPSLTFGSQPSDNAGETIYPVDTLWLHGLGGNDGLTAVLTIRQAGQIDGWVYPTPEAATRWVTSLETSPSPGRSMASTSSPLLPPITTAVHVTSSWTTGGNPCGAGHYCLSTADVYGTHPRLLGSYVIEPSGANTVATWGSVGFYNGPLGWGMPGLGTVRIWSGQWITSGSRPIYMIGDSGTKAPDNYLYPVDQVWLIGEGWNQDLTAVLSISKPGQIDGWIFPTPPLLQ